MMASRKEQSDIAKPEKIISIKNLRFCYHSHLIYKDLNIEIESSKITAIMGPSGTGKTTLLRLIGGELKPDFGEIQVMGLDVPSLSRSALYELRQRMGILFQNGGLFTDLNVFENVAFPLREHTHLPEDMIHDLVIMQLHAVGLRGAAKLSVDQLSGGMARRVAMARSMILGPEIMLYDEPFSGQDPVSRGVLIQLIRQLNDALGLTSILVSHDIAETIRVADYVYLLAAGEIIGQGEPRELLLENQSPHVKQFVQGLPDGPVRFHYPANSYLKDLGLC